MARTMTDEQERLVRERVATNGDYTMETVGVSVSLSDVIAELDAERAAHEETKAKLALAEAVCESCDEDWDEEFGGFDVYDHDALAAWRAGK